MPATQRQTTFGTVVGTDNSATSGTYAWKGVPFAAAPVGDLRWKPPVDPAAWTSPKYTQQFGNACVQSGRLYGPGLNNKYDATIGTSLGQTVGSEDCLYLNIWRPAGAATNLPVIVWVHGGSNISGYTGRPGVRRRAPRADRQRRRRLGELSPRRVRLPQHGAAEDRRRAERLGRLRDPRHHQGAASSSTATSPPSAAIPATSR